MHVRAPEPVPRKSVEGAIKQWPQAASITLGEDVLLQGDEFAKQFMLVFQCPHPATRENRRKQAQAAFRHASGQRRSFHIQLVTKNIPLHVSADKNRKEIATEMACKNLRRAISDEFGVATFIDREGGQLLAKWEPPATITPKSSSRVPRAEWKIAALADAGLNKEAAASLARRTFSDREVQWCG
eukprot:9469821-Pyramimonas_sp.AAC.1